MIIDSLSLELKNKAAIVTGGTSGIGSATAEIFAQAGASVVIAGRNSDRGKVLEKKIRSNNGVATFVYYDAKDDISIKNLVSETIALYSSIDILFNNAGMFITGPLEDLEKAAWEETFSVNINSCFLLTKYALPYLIERKGAILSNASVAGMQSDSKGRSYAYSASKAAVVQFSRACALNYGKDIRVNCICPGIIDTPMFIDRNFDRYMAGIPAKRVGTPEDVAKAALFLCSDLASYINGAVLTVDGGASL
jgi:NAD(P)-dependent dehydrogenase (short-subunit alcohol dehydrogenase family)